ncbi:MAG: AI-2E family transporter [bacterium]|nr:AI-2E family transporter [bacterium]
MTMKRHYLSISLFLTVAAAVIFLFYKLLAPFFAPLMWATVFAILFHPLYKRLLKRVKRPGLASILILFLIIIVIIGPVVLLSVMLVEQAASAVQRVTEMRQSGQLDTIWSQVAPWWDSVVQRLSPYVDIQKLDLRAMTEDAVSWLGNFFVNQTSWIIANVSKAIFYFLLMLFTLYYLLKDGEKLVERIAALMPLERSRTNAMLKELHGIINSTMISGIVIALIQGAVGGMMFALVGIPSALFWGAIMAFLSVIPLLGAFIIYVPAGLILIINGDVVQGCIIIGVGTLIVSQIDNFLRPYMVAGGTNMHPLMLFLSMTGGIALLGIEGLIAGPLVAAAFVTILEVFEIEIGPWKSEAAPLEQPPSPDSAAQ